ncbi:hypothetical protein [Aestuariibacter salexigens]|uniref:hypothetical protein n=1 Tax=Aestuariibacter salexigens TaxID=226010 RepID=UPI0012EB80E5|nr:hypothetical protein [Aestuariibacter salexigens]
MKQIIKSVFFTAAIFTTHSLWADQVILDDVIVDGSLCVGPACLVDQEFDFDTLRIRSDNPSILFQDTSSSASFPTTDWLVAVEDELANVSVFSIKNVDTGEYALQLSASADGGTAIGIGATLVAGAVTFGGEGSERRVSFVAEGTDPTDAVTLSQLNTLQNGLDSELSALEAQLSALSTRVDDLASRVDNL